MSNEPKKTDPIEARWQPVAVVSLSEEKPKRLPPEYILLDLCAGIPCLVGLFYGARIEILLACSWAAFSIALWTTLLLRSRRKK